MTVDEIIAVYEAMKSFILKPLYRVPPRYMDLEDVWQDVLLDGIDRVPRTFDPSKGASLKTYVGNTGRWYIQHTLYKWSRTPDIKLLDPNLDREKEKDPPVVFRNMDCGALVKTISNNLPPNYRVVIQYHALGYTCERIGKKLGISKQRVSVLLQEAIFKLRVFYEMEGETDETV